MIANSTPGPVRPSERIQLIDVLRGFALLGILQVNWDWRSPRGLYNLIEFFADGSFYPAFSLLFGLGFAVQLIRAEEARRPFFLRYLWRTAILLLIAIAHDAFIWNASILERYAIAAVPLLLIRRWRPPLLLVVSASLLVLAMLPWRYLPTHPLVRVDPERQEVDRFAALQVAAHRSANSTALCRAIPGLTDRYREFVCDGMTSSVARLRDISVFSLGWWKGYADVLCMFVLGLYVGRRRILTDVVKHTKLLVWVAGVAGVLGFCGNAVGVYGDPLKHIGIVLPAWTMGNQGFTYYVGNIGLTLFYLSTIALIYTYRLSARRLLAPFASVGRMGLTNYLMQSIVLFLLLRQVLALDTDVTGWWRILEINVFFIIQVLYSVWWFRYFQYGPVEWAWRSLTWFRIQPMRRPVAPQAVTVAGGR